MRFSRALAGLALALPVVVQAQRMVGYYGKTVGAGCPDNPPFAPSDLPVDLYTHLNFAFALINDEGVIAIDKAGDENIYQALNELKAKKPTLRTAITVGGWDMNMAHYSEMVSTAENRQKFINSAMKFVRERGFDGLDFDWE
ncbi:Oviduct-specific glycoprotein [Entomortierella beljakovae]|nr:Oviduct-specific glycoprotein [Entomortierella beljakovae]